MKQAKVSLKDEHIELLNRHRQLGFRDKSAMMREALDRLQREMLNRELKESAKLYAEIYEEDEDIRGLTASAISEWPE